MKKTIATVLALSFFAALAGCNTVAGFGKDVEKTGEAVQGAAKKS